MPLVMLLEDTPPYAWMLDDQVLQATLRRFAGNNHFRLLIPSRRRARILGRRLLREVPELKGKIFVGAEDPYARLLQWVERTEAESAMVIPENACGMPFASTKLVTDIVDAEIETVHSDQVVGLAPCVVSRRFLRTLAGDRDRPFTPLEPLKAQSVFPLGFRALNCTFLARRQDWAGGFFGPDFLEHFEKSDRNHNMRFVGEAAVPGPIFYLPRFEQDRALARYLLEKVAHLEQVIGSVRSLPAPASSGLALHLEKFCETFAVTYPLYGLTGEPDIPEEIRGLTSNPKSVGDCYLRAIHFVKFLKTYAGLRSTSRVLDIGCGWGLLPLGLVNVIEAPGSYVGLDIQRKAIQWAETRLAPLNRRFSFLHLDIANTRYNVNGLVQYDQIRLPIADGSADLVVLSSVFTHMRREGIESYLREIRRILAPAGILAFSYFHSSFFGLNEDYRIRFPDNPDRMTLFNTDEITRMLAENGLAPARPQVNYNGRFNATAPFFQTFMFANRND